MLEVSEARKQDLDYFGAIMDQLKAGGYEGMLHDLLERDITNFRVRTVPITTGLQGQRKLSLPTTEAWWQDCLERGYVLKSKLGLEEHFAQWIEIASMELLFASYLDFAEKRRRINWLRGGTGAVRRRRNKASIPAAGLLLSQTAL